MWPSPKSCCAPNGHCKTKTSHAPNSNRECKQLAFDHHKPFDFSVDLPTVDLAKIELPALTIQGMQHRHYTRLIEPSPPDLQVLHSIFLI